MSEVFNIRSLPMAGKLRILCPGANLTISSEGYVVLSRQMGSSIPVFYFRNGMNW